MFLYLDWNHAHTNPDGSYFPKGTVHIQKYKNYQGIEQKWKNGLTSFTRMSKQARRMTAQEIAKYGQIMHSFNPNIKFRSPLKY